MCNGSIMDKLISFSLPLMLSGILQLMFNAVDIIVVGRFSGKQALAAVGSTTALINVFTNLFIGISLGANVLAARFYAMGKSKEMSETVHTSITLAMVSGVIMAFVGVLFARGALELMGTPDDVIDQSTLYMRIYFMGMPFFMLYNYGAAILRAIGDTKRPLLFLIISGLINAALNMLLVIYCHMAVEGVAIATVISQLISGVGCLIYSIRHFEILHPEKEEMQVNKTYMMTLCGMGVPMGLQYSITAIGSVILQSAVNSLGSHAVAAMTAGSKIGMFFCCPFDALGSTMATYGGQNVGAKKLDRVSGGLKAASILGCAYAVLAFVIMFFFRGALAGFFVGEAEPEVVSNAGLFLLINSAFYIPLAFVNIVRFLIQGMGYSKFAILAGVFEMVARTLVGFAFVPVFGYVAACFASPVAWIFADAFLFPAYFHVLKKTKKMLYK
mgnify:CR=1 FL=1